MADETDEKKIAVIGAGNLGEALIRGLLEAKTVSPERMAVSDASAERLQAIESRNRLAMATTDNRRAADWADVVVIAVKPHVVARVIEDIAEGLRAEQLLISFAAAVPISRIEAGLKAPQPIVRAMPNIAMTVGASATALCSNAIATKEHIETAREIFSSVGEVVFVDEEQMHAVTGLSGSGPAYVFTILEALTAGGVKAGLPASTAAKLAAQTLLGAARMALASDLHPAALRDQVTTPGGTTIAGLHEMELQGVRGALISAVEAAVERSRELAERLG